MPNWCENILTVTGSKQAIISFKKKIKISDGQFLQSLVPIPAKTKDLNGWRNVNWGTKWDVSVTVKEDTPTLLQYIFESAWSPPEEWLRRVGSMFPRLCFHLWYAEGGMNFAGTITVEGKGVVTAELDYVGAMIDQHGSLSTMCTYCEGDMEIFASDAPRICQECATSRCSHCFKLDFEHVDGKCIFDSTTFSALGGGT